MRRGATANARRENAPAAGVGAAGMAHPAKNQLNTGPQRKMLPANTPGGAGRSRTVAPINTHVPEQREKNDGEGRTD
jgi:hypothetical protein